MIRGRVGERAAIDLRGSTGTLVLLRIDGTIHLIEREYELQPEDHRAIVELIQWEDVVEVRYMDTILLDSASTLGERWVAYQLVPTGNGSFVASLPTEIPGVGQLQLVSGTIEECCAWIVAHERGRV